MATIEYLLGLTGQELKNLTDEQLLSELSECIKNEPKPLPKIIESKSSTDELIDENPIELRPSKAKKRRKKATGLLGQLEAMREELKESGIEI